MVSPTLDLKSAKNVSSFKHKIKDKFLKDFHTQKISPYIFYQDPEAVIQRSIGNLENAAFLLTF